MTPPVSTERWAIHRYDRVTSTMDVAAQLIADGEVSTPTVVVADHQTAGRGRSDRVWRSVPGGSLQMTAILTLPVPLGRLGPVSLLLGDIVAQSIEALDPGLRTHLKWPNDVLIDGQKAAGILVVSRSVRQSSLLQIGIGVNVIDPKDPTGTSTGLTSLVERSSPVEVRDRLLSEILSRLGGLADEFATDGGSAGLERWTRRATLLGQPVRLQDGDRVIEGVMLGVDQTGALRIRKAAGLVITVVAGDLTRGPQPITDHTSRGYSEGDI